MKKRLLLIPVIIIFFISSCKKDSFNSSPEAQISFSRDTVFFDTLFTSTGSFTQSFKIKNDNDQKLLLTGIQLSGGPASVFKLNIDGSSGPAVENIELAAHDSLYVFVSVFIDPQSGHLPFVIQDSIEVSYNSNHRFVQLEAWGQNAHFMKNRIIRTDTVWSNDLPYVILGGLLIDSAASLTIQPGCQLYFHADAPLIVDGSLKVNGAAKDSLRVRFLGDRLDAPYNSFPGSWPGIYFRTSSHDNVLEYADIRNAYQALVAEDPSPNANPKLTLNACTIDNIYNTGILGAHTSIDAINCLVSNCGNNIVLGYGGQYQFEQCTVASFSNLYLSHTVPVLVMSNYVAQGSGYLTSPFSGSFSNCIFWGDLGNVDDEVALLKQGDSTVQVSFTHCLVKARNFPAGIDSTNLILNLDPLFLQVNTQQRRYDFHLQPGSPAIDAGKDLGIPKDLDGNPRPVNLPDLGAYESQ